MSDQDLDIYTGGDLAPISPAPVPDLYEKTAEDSWQDHLPVPIEDRYPATTQPGRGFQLFGNAIPQGTTEPQVQEALSAISGTYYADMCKLGHRADWCHAAVKWFQANARSAPRQEENRHNFNLHDQQNDPVANSFANVMAAVGASQEFVSNSIWWLEEVERRLIAARNDPNNATAMAAPGMATSSDPLDTLSDSQFEQVVAENERAQANTLAYFKDLWGDAYVANLRVTQEFFASLPVQEQAHLNQLTTGYIYGSNTVTILSAVYRMAIGAGTLPTTGAEIAAEIAAWENVMKNEPKRWRDDERAQMRYRHLLDLRGY